MEKDDKVIIRHLEGASISASGPMVVEWMKWVEVFIFVRQKTADGASTCAPRLKEEEA